MTYEEVLKNYYAVNELASQLVISEQERQDAIAGLRKALGLPPDKSGATNGGLCLDCGHSVEIKRVAGCLNHPVRR